MTLNELKRNVDYWISCGWGDDYVYDKNLEPIESLEIVGDVSIEDPYNPNYKYENVLVIQ